MSDETEVKTTPVKRLPLNRVLGPPSVIGSTIQDAFLECAPLAKHTTEVLSTKASEFTNSFRELGAHKVVGSHIDDANEKAANEKAIQNTNAGSATPSETPIVNESKSREIARQKVGTPVEGSFSPAAALPKVKKSQLNETKAAADVPNTLRNLNRKKVGSSVEEAFAPVAAKPIVGMSAPTASNLINKVDSEETVSAQPAEPVSTVTSRDITRKKVGTSVTDAFAPTAASPLLNAKTLKVAPSKAPALKNSAAPPKTRDFGAPVKSGGELDDAFSSIRDVTAPSAAVHEEEEKEVIDAPSLHAGNVKKQEVTAPKVDALVKASQKLAKTAEKKAKATEESQNAKMKLQSDVADAKDATEYTKHVEQLEHSDKKKVIAGAKKNENQKLNNVVKSQNNVIKKASNVSSLETQSAKSREVVSKEVKKLVENSSEETVYNCHQLKNALIVGKLSKIEDKSKNTSCVGFATQVDANGYAVSAVKCKILDNGRCPTKYDTQNCSIVPIQPHVVRNAVMKDIFDIVL